MNMRLSMYTVHVQLRENILLGSIIMEALVDSVYNNSTDSVLLHLEHDDFHDELERMLRWVDLDE